MEMFRLKWGDAPDGFLRIPLGLLRLDEVADFQLYLAPPGRGPVLYRERNLAFTDANRCRLMESGVEAVFVPDTDERAYRNYLERNLDAILDDPLLSPEQKSGVLYGSLVWVVEDVMHDPRAAGVVERSSNIVANTCKFLYDEQTTLEHLMQVMSFDYYTFTHSVNVFVFAMALGQRVFPEEQLRGGFGLGALLHDVGKSQVPDEIVNAKGRLSDAQFAIMKMHPVYGYEMLKEKGEMPEVALCMARNHHERWTGGGYPDGLVGEKIPPEVRVLTIADIFDALTTKRSYKAEMATFHALKLMRDEMGGHMDPSMFRTFVNMMAGTDAPRATTGARP